MTTGIVLNKWESAAEKTAYTNQYVATNFFRPEVQSWIAEVAYWRLNPQPSETAVKGGGQNRSAEADSWQWLKDLAAVPQKVGDAATGAGQSIEELTQMGKPVLWGFGLLEAAVIIGGGYLVLKEITKGEKIW